jgi:glycosyltransferase involved in cell wall biosynthesis
MAKKTNKKRKLKFTWSSNAHWTNSGYAVFTRDLLFRLRDDGWNFAEIGFFGLQGFPIKIDGFKVYPAMVDAYGADAMIEHTIDFGANLVFTMQDVWTLNPMHLQNLAARNIKWIPYLPIDHTPVSPHILARIKHAYKIITFSKFGQEELEKAGYASELIVEGTDPDIFKPMDKNKLRDELKIPRDKFLFGMISANKENPPRKGYQEILDALKLFIDNHPEAALFVHSQQVSPTNFPIKEYAFHLGIQNSVFSIGQYAATFKSDSEQIRKEINTFDVNMHASMTEGFGLGIVESQACGVPVIINDCHSMPELIVEGKTGEKCKTDYSWWRSQGGYVHTADVRSLHDKMETIYKKMQDPKKRKQIAKDCRQNVLTNYNINDIVKDKWIPYLTELQEELSE